jgi:hypothetical protein
MKCLTGGVDGDWKRGMSPFFDMEYEMGGQTVKMGGRDMFFFVKEDGRWWAVADQFSPYPENT